MSTVGIVAEYDPFHLGHLYQMQQAKKRTGADTVVVVLGGDFLQRGMPSMTHKRVRARMAADNGADLVLALPYVFSVNSAREYAEGAVRILSGIGCVDYISFGCENEDLSLLNRAAAVMTKEKELSPMIKEKLASGFSYPEAMTQATASLGGEEISELLRQPNNLLGCEYLRSIIELDSPLRPVPVRRIGTVSVKETGDQTDAPILSASRIRLLMETQGIEAAESFVPIQTLENLMYYHEDRLCGIMKKMDSYILKLLRYRLFTADRRELDSIYSVTEGFENRLTAAISDPGVRSVSSLVESAGTRRYTRARIMRMLTHILMNFKTEDFEWLRGASCARVLASSEKGRRLLARMRKTAAIPVLSNLSRLNRYDARTRRLMELDIRAAGLYEMLRGGNDFSEEICYVPYMS